MSSLGRLAGWHKVPVQSHLSENLDEIQWVRELHPDAGSYSDVYNEFGLFGQVPTIMAHCVHLSRKELQLIKDNGVYVAHCPQSNTNLSSGIAPIREMLDMGIHIGLGTDIAGGFSISMFRIMSDTIQASKLFSILIDKTRKPLALSEVFYMATKGGGSFWGRVGSFEPGYEMDAIVIDDRSINCTTELTLEQRLERVINLSEDQQIISKFVNGIQIF